MKKKITSTAIALIALIAFSLIFPLSILKARADSMEFVATNGSGQNPTVLPFSAGQDPSNTHWYDGAFSNLMQTASSISANIVVPNGSPLSDENYYVLLSAWDNNVSYDQIGFGTTDTGVWNIAYGWTTVDSNLQVHYHDFLYTLDLSLGASYTFNITTHNNVDSFLVTQGSTQILSTQASGTGGSSLYLQGFITWSYTFPNGTKINFVNDASDYTDYEEVYQTDVQGGAPNFVFSYSNQNWVATNGTLYGASSWSKFITAYNSSYTVPSFVNVGINGGLVNVDNHPPNSPTLSGTTTVVENATYTYTTNDDTDPDTGDQIQYHLQVDDPNGQNVYQSSTNFVSSGTPASWNLEWGPTGQLTNPIFGAYSLMVWAEDWSAGQTSSQTKLTVNLVGATITGFNLYYNSSNPNLYNVSEENLTSLHTYVNSNYPDYYADVNFTWNGGGANNVSLWIDVINPPGSPVQEAWVDPNLGPSAQYTYLAPGGNYGNSSMDLTENEPYIGTGTLRIIFKYQGLNCGEQDEPISIVNGNNAPNTPSLNYPGSGNNGTQYSFTANATDPDQDNIQYVFNWGDGTANTTLPWCASGIAGTANHTWTNAGTYNITTYVFDPYAAWSSQTAQVTMTNSSGGGGGGCPFVYDWNGSSFVEDNNILPASQNGNGTDTQDYYLLQQPLVPVFNTKKNSVYSLQIGEFESNIDYIDQVKLMAVDCSQGTSIAVTQDGEIFAYQNLLTPISAVDNNGNSELAQISTMNGNLSDPSTYYVGNKGDWLVLDFGSITGPTANLVLRDDRKCAECIYVQVPDGSGGWQNVTVLNPRDYWSIEAVNMTAYLPKTGDLIVRLYWTQTHNLDFVGLDTSAQTPPQVTSAPPALAIHSTLGDVTRKLLYDDEQCVQLVNGQTITVWFILPNQAQGTTRSFILFTDGYYYTIT